MSTPYQRLESKTSVRRSFAITLGLSEGYGRLDRQHTRQEVIDATLEYMKRRVASGMPYLSGTVSAEGTVVYAYSNAPGNAGGGSEDTVVFFGEVSVIYNPDLLDEDAKDILNEMAAHLGCILGQTRVYVTYRDEIWVLQLQKSQTPTGETV